MSSRQFQELATVHIVARLIMLIRKRKGLTADEIRFGLSNISFHLNTQIYELHNAKEKGLAVIC
jgi:hypothetical protein